MKVTLLFLMLSVLLTAGTSHAESCPQPGPEDRTVRRTLAREWFVRGEVTSKASDDLGAIRAFQCSMSLIPHGFTAYNLAQVAERSGDLELAIMSYSQYLTLMPQAGDKVQVQNRIVRLKTRLDKVTQETIPLSEAKSNPLASNTTTGPSIGSPDTLNKSVGTDSLAPTSETEKNVGTKTSWATRFGTAAWVTVGAGLITLGAGVGCNLLARSKKSKSDKLFFANDQNGADAAYDDAKQFAYTSYGLFAAGAVATTLGITLGLWPKSADKIGISLFPQGGLALSFTGRYP